MDEELLRELDQVPIVLTTQDERDVVEVVHGLKVSSAQPAVLCYGAQQSLRSRCPGVCRKGGSATSGVGSVP